MREPPPGWSYWDWGAATALRRPLDAERYVAVVPFLYTWAIIVGPATTDLYYHDRWCYDSLFAAVAAGTVWDGTGEPQGWHRHPTSGRRRPEGDVTREYVNP